MNQRQVLTATLLAVGMLTTVSYTAVAQQPQPRTQPRQNQDNLSAGDRNAT